MRPSFIQVDRAGKLRLDQDVTIPKQQKSFSLHVTGLALLQRQ